MESFFDTYFVEDQPFIIYSENYISGLCYLERVSGNHLIVFELGDDLKERIALYNVDKIEKIVGVYKGDIDFVEVNEREPSENYIF